MSRVLLVDDDAGALPIRKLILEQEGHHVFAATSADRARELFHSETPDSVILDLRIPEAENGLALIRELRAASRDVQIVVLSGWCADIDGRDESLLVDLVLSKPVRSEVLLRVIPV